jgi:hypothetical protein
VSLDTYANFQAAIADQLARSDLTTQIVDCIALFEAEASFELFRNRRIEKTTILVPSNPAAVNVTGAANNGSGLIRLTVDSTSTFTTNDEGSVSSVGGTTEADGTWLVTVISGTTMDLQGSTFTNTYTNGGTAQAPQGRVSLPTDYMGWRRLTWTGNPHSDVQYVHPSIFSISFPTFMPIALTGIPRQFTIEGTYIKTVPVDGTPLEFDYFASTPALSSSLNWLFTNRVDAYWNGVLEQVYRYMKDYEQASQYQQSKSTIFQEIKMQRFREDGQLAIRVQGSSYGATP